MNEGAFYRCPVCGKILYLINDTEVPTVCCGKHMERLEANSSDGDGEKHVPVFLKVWNKVTVNIGSKPHPMREDHYIQWVALETNRGVHIKLLSPGDKPEVAFRLSDENLLNIYEYCNRHGLWVTRNLF